MTKIHALVDASGPPIRLRITEGQAHHGRSAQSMIDTVQRGDVLLADRTYNPNALRQTLAARGARANVKPMPNRVVTLRFSRRWLARATTHGHRGSAAAWPESLAMSSATAGA